MKGYTNVESIENYLLTEIDIGFEEQIESWIEVIESYIEKKTGRVFIADATATYKKYEVEGKAENFGTISGGDLFIDESVSVSELKIDSELVNPSDYFKYPANSLPITRISLNKESGLFFAVGQQNIEVKAKWGYSVLCPADISFATMILVCGIINYSLQAEGEVKSETIGSYSVTFKDEKQWQDFERAKEILENYTKIVL